MIKHTPEQLYTQFQQTANLLRRLLHRANREVGGDMLQGQGRLLRLLSQRQGIAQKELVELMRIRPASLSELLTKLEGKGLVKRVRSEQDKRAHHIYLTDAGGAMAARMERAKSDYGRDAFSVLDEAEGAALAAMLDKLSAAVEQKMADLDEGDAQ